jgi:putative sterol carrier protein
MGVQFLSDEWTAAVQDALNSNAAFKSAIATTSAKVQQVVTTEDGEKRYWFKLEGGEASLGTGDLEGAETTITQDYDTAKKLSTNELTGTAAYMSGKLKVAGDMMKLLQLQGALGQMPAALAGLDVDYE